MRIRSIRPEFWTSEDVAGMDWYTRLVYVGLWSYVDDNGVGRDVEALIVAALFPLDGDIPESSRRVTGALRHLSTHGQITRYRVDGKAYLHVNQWLTHQRIEKKSLGRYPLPTSENAEIQEPSPTTTGVLPEPSTPGEGEKGRRGEGEKSKEAPTRSVAATGSKPPKPITIEHSTASAVFERIGKAGNFMALRGIVKWAIHERGENPATVEDAIFTVYGMGKPITKTVVGQYLDGHFGRQGSAPGISRVDQKVQGWLDIGARLTSQQGEPREITS